MDPLAHTLIGATLAETRLKTWSAQATPMLLLGANAPDIDAVTMLIERDLSLGFRRGWTHGILALIVLPILLTALIVLADRIIAKLRSREPTAQSKPLFALAVIAVLTHPVLDWLNTYGMRFLMPFDGTWFYGDALFVVDPWVWLLTAMTVVLGHTSTRLSIVGWVILGLATTSLITGFDGAPTATRFVWCAGIVGIVWLRTAGHWQLHLPRLATACLSAVATYIIVMIALSQLAETQVAAWLTERDDSPAEIMASPTPGNPFRRNIVVADAEHYHFLELDWLRADPIRISNRAIARGPENAITRAALQDPRISGFATWTRFPVFAIENTDYGYRVAISDARYSQRIGQGLGAAIVELDHELNVR